LTNCCWEFKCIILVNSLNNVEESDTFVDDRDWDFDDLMLKKIIFFIYLYIENKN
jgi:hypothetical protein